MGQRIDQNLAELENLVGVTKGDPAGVAEHQAAPWLLNRVLPSCRLQQRQLAADGLHGNIQSLGGACNTAFLGDDPEVVQVLEINLCPYKFIRKTEVKLNFAPVLCFVQCTIIRPSNEMGEIHETRRFFLLTNLAVMLVLSVVTSLLGVNKFLTANGLNLGMLLAFAAVIGFGGAFISLLMSKTMAKWSTGAQVITQAQFLDRSLAGRYRRQRPSRKCQPADAGSGDL